MLFAGLDISLRNTAFCVVDELGAIVAEGSTLSDPGALAAKLEGWRTDLALVGLEACPLSEWIYAGLVDAGIEARCIETRHAQRFLSTRPNKTDRNDARGIAAMMRLGHFKPVHVKSKAAQLQRAVLVGRAQIVSTMLQIENTIRGLMRVQGLKIGKVHRNRYSERVRELCQRAPLLLPAVEPLLEARDTMRAQQVKMDRALVRTIREDPICRLLMTVPGVGPITALAFKVTVDDPARFSSSKAVAAHLGLTPRVYQSGEIDRSGHISKIGDKLMRHLLTEAATALLTRSRKWCALKAWGTRLARKVGMAKAIVAVARKLAVTLHSMWLSNEPFRFGAADAAPNAP